MSVCRVDCLSFNGRIQCSSELWLENGFLVCQYLSWLLQYVFVAMHNASLYVGLGRNLFLDCSRSELLGVDESDWVQQVSGANTITRDSEEKEATLGMRGMVAGTMTTPT